MYTDKIYDAYPYEYFYCRGAFHKPKLKDELKDMNIGIFRDYHEKYVATQECVLGRKDITHS